MGLFKKFCWCQSGKEAGFCYPHKGATARGTTSGGRRTSGGAKVVRRDPKKPGRR